MGSIWITSVDEKAGCRVVAYGESGNKVSRSCVKMYPLKKSAFQSRGGQIAFSGIYDFGDPGESADDVRKSLAFCHELERTMFNSLLLVPCQVRICQFSVLPTLFCEKSTWSRCISSDDLGSSARGTQNALTKAWIGFYIRPQAMGSLSTVEKRFMKEDASCDGLGRWAISTSKFQ